MESNDSRKSKYAAKTKAWKLANREKVLAQKKRHHARHRQLCLEHYGRVCACCGEAHEEFLAIDHTAGGGNKHRREIGKKAGNQFYVWLIRNNFPTGYRTLCHNCNQSIGYYGYCPHEKDRIIEQPIAS